MRDPEGSRRRLLEAATAEFALHGVAGARVDRIAATASVNKAQMYAWFGSKDGLFDAVFDEHLVGILDAVPFTPDDLPGYAVRLYDSYLTDPELVRLAGWNRLERVPVGDLLPDRADLTDPKRAAIVASQRAGRIVDDLEPGDVYALVISIAGTWSPVSATYTASTADDEADHERRRTALRAVVTRCLVP